jgi:hypothetical protein
VAPGEGPAPVVASGETGAAPEHTEPRSPT